MKIGNHNIDRALVLSEEDWQAERKKYIGSSDAPALFGEGYANMPNIWSLWAEKTGKVVRDDELDERAQWGRLLEQPILEMVCRRTGWQQLRPTHGQHIWKDTPNEISSSPARLLIPAPAANDAMLAATCDDFVLDHEDGLGLIEVKNRDWLAWRDNYTEERAAARDRIQLAAQMICVPEAQWGVIAVLVGGNELRLYHETRESLAEIMDEIHVRASWFWAEHKAGNEPPLLDERELPAWARLHRDDEVHEGPLQIGGDDREAFDAACRIYNESSELAKEHKKAADKAKAYIVSVAEKNKAVQSAGWFAKLTYTPTAEQVVELPEAIKASLDGEATYDGVGPELSGAIQEAIGWRKVTRKASMSTKLSVEPLATAQEGPTDGDYDIVEEIGKANIGA